MLKAIGAAFVAGFVMGFLFGAYHSDHTLTQSIGELIRVKQMIREEFDVE